MEEEAVHLMADRKLRKRKQLETTCNFQKYTRWNVFPPFSPYLLMFPQPPKMVSSTGDQVFNT
jgi:hypothetical protein